VAKHRDRGKASPGWPRDRAGSRVSRNYDEVRKQVSMIERMRVPQEELGRHFARLQRMLAEWSQFVMVRPPIGALGSALDSLSEAEVQALDNPAAATTRRAVRARRKLLAMAFDDEVRDMARTALVNAIPRAGSPDDIGALALMAYSLTAWASESLPLESNPFLAALLGVSLHDFHELARTVNKVTADANVGEGDREAAIDETLPNEPALMMLAQREVARLASRLTRYISSGVIEAPLPLEPLDPLIEAIKHAAAGVGDARQPDAAESFVSLVRGFAADPANDPLFEQFRADLESQAAATTEEPLATRLGELVKFCEKLGSADASTRLLVCEASIRRHLLKAGPPGEGRKLADAAGTDEGSQEDGASPPA